MAERTPFVPFRTKLRRAITAARAADKSFTGTSYGIAHAAGIGHQQVLNLLNGHTNPWEIKIKSAWGLVQALPKLTIEDFYPHEGYDTKKGRVAAARRERNRIYQAERYRKKRQAADKHPA